MARRAAALAVVAAVALALVARPSDAATQVVRQAWARVTPVGTFVPEDGRVYVAATGTFEEARTFVQLLSVGDDLTAASLSLTEADGSVEAAGASVIACLLAEPLTASGEVAADDAPEADCRVQAPATRDEQGTWSVDLEVFAPTWEDGGTAGLVLVPDVPEGSLGTFRLALDTSATTVRGARPVFQPAPSSTTTTTRGGAPPPTFSFDDPLPAPPIATPTTATDPPAPSTPPRRDAPRRPAPLQPDVLSVDKALSPAAWPVFLALLAVTGAVLASPRVRRRVDVPPRLKGPGGVGALGYGALGVVALLPMLGSQLTVFRAGLVVIFVVAAIGLHVLVNWAGELSLAHAAMIGLPAFVVATASEVWGVSPVYLLPLGLVVGALVGLVVAMPVLRTRGLQVALVTLVAGKAIERYFFTQEWLSPRVGRVASDVTLGPLHLDTPKSLYPLLLALALLAVTVAWALLHGKLARGWFWVRANPSAASAFGVPVVLYRVMAYVVGGAFAGFAGGLTVMWVQRLSPSAFPSTLSVTYLVVAIIAGPGFVGGLATAGGFLEAGRLFVSGTGAVIAYAGPVALVLTITRYDAGLNGLGRKLMERIVGQRAAEGDGLDASAEPPERVNLSFVGGVVAIVAGFLAIGLAWYHAGNTNQVWIQNQEMISGGLGGIALVLTGIGLLIRDRLIHTQRLLARQLEATANGARLLAEATPDATTTAPAPAPAPGTAPTATEAPGRSRRRRALAGS